MVHTAADVGDCLDRGDNALDGRQTILAAHGAEALLRKGVRLTQAAGMLARSKSRKSSSRASAAADWGGWDYGGGGGPR